MFAKASNSSSSSLSLKNISLRSGSSLFAYFLAALLTTSSFFTILMTLTISIGLSLARV